MNLSGLSAAYPGYVQGRKDIASADIEEGKAQDIQTALMGRQAFGRALQAMFGQGAPPPPMPGQASVPSMPQQQPQMQQQQAMQPLPPVEGPQQPVQGGMFGGMAGWQPGERPMMNAGQAPTPPANFADRFGAANPPPPQNQPAMNPMPQGGGQMPPGAQQPMGGAPTGSLDWRVIIQSVAKANPGAPPQVIAAAVDQFAPMMNQESKLQWQQMKTQLQLEMQQNKIDMTGKIAELRDKGADRRTDARIAATQPAPGAGMSEDAIVAGAERYLKSGQLPPNLGRGVQGRQDMVAIQNKAAELARERGIKAEDLPKMHQRFKAGQIAIQRWESGPQGNTARSMNVAIDHISTIDELAQALKNGNIPVFNRIAQQIAEQTGRPAPTNLDAAKAIIGPEIIKAIGVAGAGTKEERQHAADAWNRARSPAQLAGATATIKKLLAGQLRGMRQQYIKSTGLQGKDFDDMMLPETLRQLEGLESKGTTGAPKAGDVIDGFRFKGGDPAKQENWEKS